MLTGHSGKYLAAHEAGTTVVYYHSATDRVITSGTDCKVSVWDSIEDDDEPLQVFKLGGDLPHFAVLDDTLYRASDKGNSLMSYGSEDGQTKGLVTRFTAAITHIASSKTHVAAASSDFVIKVMTSSGDVCVLSGHEAPVLRVALSPQKDHLLSASCDGSVRLWKIKTRCCLKTYNLLPKVSDVSLSKSTCGLSWSHDSSRYVIPVDTKLMLFDRDGEEAKNTLTHDSISQPINLSAYSADDKLLAAATTDGLIIVWSTSDYLPVHSIRSAGNPNITGLCWGEGHRLIFTTDQGKLSWCDVRIDGEEQANQKSANAAASQSNPMSTEQIADLFDDDDDDLAGAESDADADYQDIIEEYEAKESAKTKKPANHVIESSDEEVEPKEDKTQEIKANRRTLDDMDTDSLMSDMTTTTTAAAAAASDTVAVASAAAICRQQEAFQPGSTPSSQRSHFLVWNDVGVIRSYSDGDDSIDIEFHDISRHHTIHINNTEQYSMADLSHSCAVLATKSNSSGKSSLLCITLSTDFDQQQWSVTLDKGEEVICVCAGADFVAMATNKQMIRSFTSAGFQLPPFLLPGRAVCIRGYDSVMMSVYHTAPAGADSQQYMSASVLTIGRPQREILTHNSALPLPDAASLIWCGFTAQGTPAIYDSNGLLSLYRIHGHDIWTPVLNTKMKHKSSLHFIVSLSECPNQLRSVICKPGKAPPTNPRPVVDITTFTLPLCNLDGEFGQQEAEFWSRRLSSQAAAYWLADDSQTACKAESLVTENCKQEQTILLKLFSAACREERTERAYQISELMSEQYMRLAAQYANRTNSSELARRVAHRAEQKAKRRLVSEEGEETVFRVDQPYTGNQQGYSHNSYRRDDSTNCEENPDETSDQLTTFTSMRFSTTPSKSLAASLHRSSQGQKNSPVSDTSKKSPFVDVLASKREAAEESLDETSQSQDAIPGGSSAGSRKVNPFKSKESASHKYMSLEQLYLRSQEVGVQQPHKRSSKVVSEPAAAPASASKQLKLFECNNKSPKKNDENQVVTPTTAAAGSTSSKISAFDLYFKSEYDADPERRLSALDTFKTLSKEVKKDYIAKAKAHNQSESSSKQTTETKKRKVDSLQGAEEIIDETITSNKKPVLVASNSTKSKLAAFMPN